MSGPLSVPNTFQNSVTATGLQLDTNFNTITAYINDPTNRNNYAADSSGSTNTIALSFNPAVTAYSAGLEITFKAALGNTGAVVLNANGLGNKNLFSPAGVALAGGEITANQMVSAAYDGTQFQMLSGQQNVVAASPGTVSAALSNSSFVTPGRMVNHPAMPKAVGAFIGTNTGTITAQYAYNVAQIVRTGAGTYTVSLTTPMASTAYAVIANTNQSLVGGVINGSTTTTGFGLRVENNAGSAVDAVNIAFAVYGTQ